MRRFVSRVVAVSLLASSASVAIPASAEGPAATESELAVGRQLFAEALDDEEHRRYSVALEKYQRVLKIRDTSSIRYRMGVTLEALGRVKSAVDAYRAAARSAATASDAEIARASQARIDALEPKVAHLALRVGPAAEGVEIRVDDEVMPAEALGDVRLDPGAHVVEATAPGRPTFRSRITLSEGGRAEIPIPFEPAPTPLPSAEPPTEPKRESPLPTIGIITAGAGAALVIGGVVVALLRSDAISELNASCPNGDCPRSRERELRDTHDRAVFQGPLAGALLGVGAAAMGTGVVLFAVGRDPKRVARITPGPGAHALGLGVGGTF